MPATKFKRTRKRKCAALAHPALAAFAHPCCITQIKINALFLYLRVFADYCVSLIAGLDRSYKIYLRLCIESDHYTGC